MRNRLSSVVLIAAIVFSASPAFAKKPDGKATDPNRKICRTETPTGSIRPVSICHPASVWAEMDALIGANTARWADNKPNYTVYRDK